jgi:hypothetical protein
LSKEKSPVTVDELQELVKLLAKYIATQKGANVQRTNTEAHAMLVKWNKFQRVYKNRIEHFLPRIGDHLEVTLHGMITNWDPMQKIMSARMWLLLSIFLKTFWPNTKNGTENTSCQPLSRRKRPNFS